MSQFCVANESSPCRIGVRGALLFGRSGFRGARGVYAFGSVVCARERGEVCFFFPVGR